MVTLLNTLISEEGALFSIAHGRRVLFAHCKPEISIYEKSTRIPVLGASGGRMKTMRFTVALCGDMDFTGRAEVETLQKIERFELTADITRNDGVIERFYFHNISLTEINPDGKWEFELYATEEQKKTLSEMAGI